MDTMVTCSDITKEFTDESGTLTVLRKISFSVERGELVGLLGSSGAGKTTLLQIIGGLDLPTGGTVRTAGRDPAGLSPAALARFRAADIGFVFQFHHLLPDFTALENTFMPGLILGRSRRDCIERARELLDAVGLGRRMTHYPSELSGGERQRVALARALFNEPALILADEPTGNLDRKNGALLLELFHKANETYGQTIMVATHDAQISGGMNRTLQLEDGVLVDTPA